MAGIQLSSKKLSKFFLIFTKLVSKETWKVNSYFQLTIIFIVFALAGSLSVKIAYPITELVGLNVETTSPWIFWPIRILLILPIYQVLLISIGTLFGQYSYFSKFLKKSLSRFKPSKRTLSRT
jgi:hypothetical protein